MRRGVPGDLLQQSDPDAHGVTVPWKIDAHPTPLAVMNAGLAGVMQELFGTDIGGHCSLWGNWPNT
jgi:hypothetical protein